MSACAICAHQAGPWGWIDVKKPISSRTRLWFCSRRHEAIWLRWIDEEFYPMAKLNEAECRAIEASLPTVGQHVMHAGLMEKPFKDLTRDEALRLCASVVKAYQDNLTTITMAEGPPL